MYLNTKETSAFVGLTRARIEQLIKEGKFPRPLQHQPHGRRLWDRDELIAWTESRRVPGPEADHITTSEAAALLRLTTTRLWQLLREGKTSFPKPIGAAGRAKLWSRSELEAWMRGAKS